MGSSDNDILSQIPEVEDESNQDERGIRVEISRLKKECAKEEIKRIEFQDLYVRRQQYISNLTVQHEVTRIRQKFIKVFLETLRENVKRQKKLVNRFASLDLKGVLSNHDVTCDPSFQESVRKLEEAQSALNGIKEKINSLDIAKDFKQKQRICLEKSMEFHRLKEEYEREIKTIDQETGRYKTNEMHLILSLVQGEGETRVLKEKIVRLNQNIAAEIKEKENKQMNIKALEDEIQEMGKELKVIEQGEEIDKYLNPSTIEHVDIFKVPLNSPIKKRKPCLLQKHPLGLGIKTFLADIRRSVSIQEKNTVVIAGVQQDSTDKASASEHSGVASANEISQGDSYAQTNAELANTSSSLISVDENGHQNANPVSIQCSQKRIIVLENVIIKSAGNLSPDDQKGNQEMLEISEEKSTELRGPDPHEDVENSRQVISVSSTENNCNDSTTEVAPLAQQGAKSRTSGQNDVVQFRRTVESRGDSAEQIGEVSQLLQKVEDFLAVTSPRNKTKSKRKHAEGLFGESRSSKRAERKQLNVAFDVSDDEMLKKFKQQESGPSSTATAQKILSRKSSTDRKPKPLESFNIQSCLLDGGKLSKNVCPSNSDSQFNLKTGVKEKDKSLKAAKQPSGSQESSAGSELQEMGEENEPGKKTFKKNFGNDFTDFFENLYNSNETGDFEFDENVEMNFDAWSKTGEEEAAGSVDFSVDMDMDGDLEISDRR